jgi:hypothetical protein
MSKLAVYTLDKSNFTHLDGNSKRLFEFVDLDFNENNHGVSKPIAQMFPISFKKMVLMVLLLLLFQFLNMLKMKKILMLKENTV